MQKNDTVQTAKKFGEEAFEVVIAALKGSRKRLVAESADLLLRLQALWNARGITDGDVKTELTDRGKAIRVARALSKTKKARRR